MSRQEPITFDYIKGRSAPTETGCWEWTGSRTQNNYGRIDRGITAFYAHRKMWEVVKGQPIPEGLLIRHTCDNPPCVNPDHLLLGTFADNMRDAAERGRMKWGGMMGSRVGTAKLDEQKVAAIRQALKAGKSQRSLAREYDVSKRTIMFIAHGQSWKHVA